MAVCCPLLNNRPNFALCGEREPQRIIFKIYISNLTLCSVTSLEIVYTKRNKLNDFIVS